MVCLTTQRIDTKLVSEALKALGKENFALIVHGSSFPSKEGEDTGFGTFNSSAGHELIDYAHGIFNALQLGPAGKTKSSDSSPYTGTIFSGNPLFIDLKQLTEKNGIIFYRRKLLKRLLLVIRIKIRGKQHILI